MSRLDGKFTIDNLPPGTITTCYVDPDDPGEAVIYRGFSWVYLFALLPLVFIAIGGGGMLFALTRGIGKKIAGRKRGGGKTAADPSTQAQSVAWPSFGS